MFFQGFDIVTLITGSNFFLYNSKQIKRNIKKNIFISVMKINFQLNRKDVINKMYITNV